MSAKEKRDKLLKKSKPTFRPMTNDDYGILWAAYKKGAFSLPRDLSKDKFFEEMQKTLLRYHTAWFCEDECKSYESGKGPIALIVANTNGWMLEPHVEFFKWATPRNILRGNVAFFQRMKYDKFVGVCLVKSFEKNVNLFQHLSKYGVLFPAGKIPFATPMGTQYLFYVWGGKNVRANGDRQERKRLHRDGTGGRPTSPGVQRIPSDERQDVQCAS